MQAPPESTPREHRLVDLDATRGLAALAVCASHAWFLSAVPAAAAADRSFALRALNGIARRLFDGGAAVDYFFVLSGFVLALPFVGAAGKSLFVDEFLVRRVVRIMPTYWAALAIALVLRVLVDTSWTDVGTTQATLMDWWKPLSLSEIGRHVVLVWSNLDIRLINGPIWSLAVEMQVSLLLPLVIAALQVRRPLSSGLAVLGISIFVALRFDRQGPLPFLPLFVFGALLATCKDEAVAWIESLPRPARIGLSLLAAVLVWNRAFQDRWQYPDVEQEWLSGAGSGLFILIVLARAYPKPLLQTPLSEFFGRISYSLYLAHLPVLQATTIALRTFRWSEWLVVPVGLVLAVALSAALYFGVERPSITWGRHVASLFKRRRATRDPLPGPGTTP